MDLTFILERLDWINRVAAGVWVFLTVLMILAIAKMAKVEGQLWQRYSYWLLALIAAVWLYPLYTFGFRLVPGLIGNIGIGLLAAYVAWVLSRRSAMAAGLILPMLGWLSVATVYVVLQLIQRSTDAGG